MAAARKFAFDTVFAPDGAILRDGNGFRSQFTADEVEAARAVAFEEGRHVETARAEKQAAEAMQDLARTINTLLGGLEKECAALREEAGALALAAARQAAGAALNAFGDDKIVAAVEESLEQLRHAPRLTVRVPTNSYGALRPRLENLAQATAYPSALLVREDASLQTGDVTLEWAEGLIAFDRETLFARIEDIMTRSFETARAQQETSP